MNDENRQYAERYKALGNAIAYYRRQRRMTQEEVAEKAGISRQHIGAIEAPNMVRPISLDVVFRIADVLGVETYQLFRLGTDS